MIMDKNKSSAKLRKTAKAMGIALRVMLILGGIALMLFFVWLGLSVYTWLGV